MAKQPNQNQAAETNIPKMAVETKFKVGDKVYKYGETDVKTVLEVFEDGYMRISNYPHRVNHEVICYATPENHAMLSKPYPYIEFEQPPKPFVVDYGGRELKEMASAADAKEWVEQTHYHSSLQKAGFKPVDQKALEPTVYRLDYYDGDYYWYLVHSYDRAELEKLIADATEYHKTIKDLDFDDDEAVDAWLEKHPLNDFNGDSINDLLEIDDYEPLSAYLSINSFEVSGVSE